jgi:glycosyltransferase involved in cell wall biosynthesis
LRENVLQLVHGFIQGGSESQMIQLTRLLCHSGRFHVHVACLDGSGVLRPEIDKLHLSELPEYRLTSFYDQNMITQLRRFASHLRSRQISLVHTHDYYSNIFGMAGAFLAGVRVRIGSRRETSGLRTAAQKQLELLAFRLSQAVVVNAEAVRDHLLKEGVPGKKPVVIYNGLDLSRFPQESDLPETVTLSALKLPNEIKGHRPRFVTIVANMHHDVKDIPMFLRSARRVHEAFPEAVFLLVGDGSMIESLRQLSREMGIGDNTEFLGHCKNVEQVLRLSEVCVLSSKAEGFSNSILEYMAAGKPVVVTDVGGAREAVREGETGYLVAAGDDHAMSDRLISLLSNPQRGREMGQLGRQLVEENFSCKAQLGKTEALYEKLLGQSQNDPAVPVNDTRIESIEIP